MEILTFVLLGLRVVVQVDGLVCSAKHVVAERVLRHGLWMWKMANGWPCLVWGIVGA